MDVINAAQDRRAFGSEHADHDDDGRAQCRRTDDFGSLELGRAFYVEAMRISEQGVGAQLIELLVVDGALFI